MTRRGDRLRAFADRLFDAGTMARVIDPAIADLQIERRSWVGYFAVIKVIVLCGLGGSMRVFHSWPDDERRVLWRTIGISCGALACLTLALAWPPVEFYFRNTLLDRTHVGWLPMMLRLLPYALSLSVPMALTLGLGFSLGGRVASRRMEAAVVVIAIACSMATFANAGWLTPAANQSFRLLAATHAGVNPAGVRRGPPELSIRELRRQVQLAGAEDTALRPDLRLTKLAYYYRWGISFAPLVLAMFMLSIVAGRVVRRWVLGLTASVAAVGYVMVMQLERDLALAGWSAPLAAWLPNIALFVIAAAFVASGVLRGRRLEFAR